MTTPPLPRKPTGKLAFAYQTIATLEQARADLEAENQRLREALDDIRVSTTDHDTMLKARAALERKP